jgi:uncharacterized protein YdeI (YjbR/CyaY-like superfamily)
LPKNNNDTKQSLQATFFESQEAFRKWLKQHHRASQSLLVGYYKVSTKRPSMTWSESVDQALCFGWIDGVRRSIDEESYCIRFTPRKPASIWSAINIKKVAALTAAGLMTPEGLKAFGIRKEHRSGVYSHEKEAGILSTQFEKRFRSNKPAWKFFTEQAPSYKKVIIHWIMTAKQEVTRQSRLEKTIALSAEKKRAI